MKDYEDEAFDELEKAQQRKVAHGVTDGSKVTIDRAKLEQVLSTMESCKLSNYGRDWIWPATAHEQAMKNVIEAIITLKEALEQA